MPYGFDYIPPPRRRHGYERQYGYARDYGSGRDHGPSGEYRPSRDYGPGRDRGHVPEWRGYGRAFGERGRDEGGYGRIYRGYDRGYHHPRRHRDDWEHESAPRGAYPPGWGGGFMYGLEGGGLYPTPFYLLNEELEDYDVDYRGPSRRGWPRR